MTESETTVDREVRGEKGSECRYENCEREATTLVRFKETGSNLHVWFCQHHAGYSVMSHDDAETVEETEA